MSPILFGADVLQERLFGGDSEVATWALLDGASVKGLVRAIGTHNVESACLFSGELHPSMARVAPYLVRLDWDSDFAEWLFSKGWSRSWGVFVRSNASRVDLQKHLRSLLNVKNPEGKVLHFRFYDPRVLRVFLPTCNDDEVAKMFGPVQAFAMESEDGLGLLQFKPAAAPIEPELYPLENV